MMNEKSNLLANETFKISERYSVDFFSPLGILWSTWEAYGCPCFTEELLADMHSGFATISDGSFVHTSELRYFVLRSKFNNVFNLGGDLNLFYSLIKNKNRHKLIDYGKMSIRLIHALHHGLDRDIVTIALVQGRCLGGGFEAALACDYIIAEQDAEFSFPEILLGIYPGMGAVSLAARRIKKSSLEVIFHTGKTFSAIDLLNLGIIDHVVGCGEGENAVIAFAQKRHISYDAHCVMLNIRKKVLPLTMKELMRGLELWVDCVMNLDKRRLLILLQAAEKQSELRYR